MLDILRKLDLLAYPPALNFILLLLALLFWKRRRIAFGLISFSVISLYIFSLPIVSHALIQSLENYPALTPEILNDTDADIIVVLGGGLRLNAVEYGGSSLPGSSLERVRYAAFLHRKKSVPILFSGGYYLGGGHSEARTAKKILAHEYLIEDVLTEENSKTTRENAAMSAKILKQRKLTKIFLVTHGWHMKRAVKLFKEQGLTVMPAPTVMAFSSPVIWRDFIPNGDALAETRIALHEYLGRLLYFL